MRASLPQATAPAVARRSFSDRPCRAGFTLVEMLVVIAIIGILVALLLPAVQAARESARRTECQNHLKQMGVAFERHHEIQGFFPTGGWGWNWVGDPDAGFAERQPGGWLYNILPFCELQALHDLGLGESDATKKAAAITERMMTPVPLFNCPTRRRAELYPTPYNMNNAAATSRVAKTDYGVNCGSQARNEIDPGPGPGSTTPPATPTLETGISFRCSTITHADVIDGTTQTIMVGEKYLALWLWAAGTDAADNENMYCGYDNDLFRSTHRGFGVPRSDINNVVQYTFGSAHPSGFNIVLCDGSVRMIAYEIDLDVYECLGNRQDRVPINGRF